MQSLSADLLRGQTLNSRYRIQRLIGRGGVGVVYLANDLTTGRDVVVKCLAEHWLDDLEAVARFEREARRLDSLRHQNIVSMLGFERDAGRAFLIMEHVQGRPLSKYISERGALTFEEFVPIAAQILKGMGYAHSRGVMIRDVKPSNIMLCEKNGRANFVKILDFGLAKLLRGDTRITEEHIIGTVGYLAPETLKGAPGDLRVDVYATGVLFYYMLAGRLPFEGENDAAIFYKTISEDPIDLDHLLPVGHAVPGALIALVHRCLAKDPNERPADANLIVEQLIDAVPSTFFRLPRVGESGSHAAASVVAGETGLVSILGSRPSGEETGPSATLTDRRSGWKRRRRLKYGALSAVSAILVMIGVTATMKRASDPPASAPAHVPIEEANVDLPVPPPPPISSTRKPAGDKPRKRSAGVRARSSAASTARAADAGIGVVMFDAEPVAELFIDGESRGRTPYQGKLEVGTHRVRMSARGFEPWSSSYEVLAGPNEPMRVRLIETTTKADRPRRTTASARAESRPIETSSVPAGDPDVQTPRAAVRNDGTSDEPLMSKRRRSPSSDGIFLSREGKETANQALLRSR